MVETKGAHYCRLSEAFARVRRSYMADNESRRQLSLAHTRCRDFARGRSIVEEELLLPADVLCVHAQHEDSWHCARRNIQVCMQLWAFVVQETCLHVYHHQHHWMTHMHAM